MRLLERVQGLLEERLGEGRVVDASALIVHHELVVPHCLCDCFGVYPRDRPALLEVPGVVGVVRRHDAARDKQFMDLVEHRLNFSLHAVDVEVLGISMAGLAARHCRQVGMVSFISHMAGHAGVLNRLIMRARAAAHTQSAFAEQHRGFNTVVGAEPGICTEVYVSSARHGQIVTDLVAVGAQVAFAAVKGTAGLLQHHWLFTSRQGEVVLCVSGVDVVAGAAVEWRDIRHAFNRRVMRGQAGVDARLGALTTVATGTVGAFASYEGLARPMHRKLLELRLLGEDQGGVIVAFGAG